MLVLVLEAFLVHVRVRVDQIAVPVLVLVLDVLVVVSRMRVRMRHVPMAVLVAVRAIVLVLVHAPTVPAARETAPELRSVHCAAWPMSRCPACPTRWRKARS